MTNKSLFTVQLPTVRSSKTLIAAALLSIFSSTALYAHDSCDVDLEAGLTINESILEFFESENKDQILYSIDNNYNLTAYGENISLNSEQQALVEQYDTRIRAMVPQVRHIAIDGIDLALESVNLTFNELLGEGNKVGADLTHELSLLKKEVSTRFTIEHGFTLGEDGLEDNKLLGKEFERRVESAVEKAVANSMGSLLVMLGQEMMLSGGDGGDDFETRMKSFGENIENKMELITEKIKRKADNLCLAAIEIDQLEEALKASIEPLANINTLTVKHIRGHDEHDKSSM